MGFTLCRKYQPDVVLMHILMPELGSIATTRLIHESWPSIAIIALTSADGDNVIPDVLKAGAIDYSLKMGSIDEVADVVHAAYRHQSTLSSQAIQALIKATQHPHKLGYDLTKRQQEVLKLMIDGLKPPNCKVFSH